MALSKFNFNSFDVTTAASAGLGFNASANGFSTINPGAMTLIKTLTASSSSTVSFVHGSSDVVLDSTYPVYLFKFINMHASAINAHFSVNFRDGGSSYDATKTTTYIKVRHGEDDSLGSIVYDDGNDLAQSTASQKLHENSLTNNDSSLSGSMYLFNPASTTFVKHFASNINSMANPSISDNILVSGYCNVTAAIDGVQFTFSSGNIDAGTIKLYGVSDS
jgi:hypothetical protein